jgi:hypothetical protein
MFIYPPTITNYSILRTSYFTAYYEDSTIERLEDILVYAVQGYDRTFEHPFRGPVL